MNYLLCRAYDSDRLLLFVYYTTEVTRSFDEADIRSKIPGFAERCKTVDVEKRSCDASTIRLEVRRLQRREHPRYKDANI